MTDESHIYYIRYTMHFFLYDDLQMSAYNGRLNTN